MKKRLKLLLTSIGDGLAIGVGIGLMAAFFLLSLEWVTELFKLNSDLLWLLPIAGLLTAWLYKHHGGDSYLGNHLIIDEIHSPKKKIPLLMAPLVLISTLLTHLFGASAGREGTAVQMGASIADSLARLFKADSERRRRFLVAGMGAGFGAAIGTPLAGAIFGMEVLRVGRLKPIAIVESVVAAYTGQWIAHLCHAPHTIYPTVHAYFSPSLLLYLAIAAIMFGIMARLFIFMAHFVESFTAKAIPSSLLRPFIVAFILILFFKLEGSDRFHGLGLEVIQEAFRTSADATLPLIKAFFTALTVGSGFKGGEFTPLAYIGATAGSAFAGQFAVPTALFAALGFAAVFGAASKTPIACAVMAAELFGIQCFPYALITCLIAHHFAGMKSIYRFQKADSLVLISRIKTWIFH